MIRMAFDAQLSEFKGKCPRCGEGGFFRPRTEFTYEGQTVRTVICNGGHMFCIEHINGRPESITNVWPIQYNEMVPTWLPNEYRGAFLEMHEDFVSQRYRSAIAMCSMILDAFLNSQLPNEGDKKKMLYSKIEAARNLGKIDHDQFSDATITRLTRNEILHPEDILSNVTVTEAKEAIDSILAVLERAFKFRSSRALPAPKGE